LLLVFIVFVFLGILATLGTCPWCRQSPLDGNKDPKVQVSDTTGAEQRTHAGSQKEKNKAKAILKNCLFTCCFLIYFFP
jgi:hypothetical protein